ncbi:MAG: hypothetical protein IKW46_01120 [Bacteroidaceae bacterium]|nr:hypothetical protein [Bacteroidaceae bacterium]
MRNNGEKRLQRVVATVCATLFAVFTFLFVGVYQAPLLEAFYNEVATGKLDYNPWLVGGVVSLVLTLLALWLNSFAKLRREWTALAYLPSALLLAFITDVDRCLYTGAGFSYSWIFIFALGLAFYGFIAFVLRRILFEKIKDVTMVTNRVLWRNMMLLVLMMCLVGTLSNGDGDFKRETLTMSRFNNGDFDGALRVGKNSLEASRELTAMRAYILASENALGEHFFEYPQYYAAEGLLPPQQRTSSLVPDSVYSLLGAAPSMDEVATDYFARIVSTDSVTNVAQDYYFMSLLLEKRLIEFKENVLALYGAANADSLPKHYREALMLYTDIADPAEEQTFVINDASMRERFGAMRAEEAKHSDAFVRGNYVRLQFGDTYWWYYLYSN